jgi:hypothetical protein
MPHRHSISELNDKLRALNLNDTDYIQIDIMATTFDNQNGHDTLNDQNGDIAWNETAFGSLSLESQNNDSETHLIISHH